MSTTTMAHPATAHATSSHPSAYFSRRRIVVALLLVLGATGAALGAKRIANRAPSSPVQVQSAPLDRGAITAKVTATGTVSALVTVSVGAQVSGRISSLGADFESEVRAGQTIATIDPSLFKAALAQARANYDAAIATAAKAEAARVNADKQFARAKLLLSQGLMTGADYDVFESQAAGARADVVAARAAISQTKAALDQAALNVSYTTIVSPIDGIVISRNVDVGQTVAAALQAPTLFVIAQDLTRMQVDTAVAEADVGKIRPGMKATFTVDAYPGKSFEGLVRQVRDNAQTQQNVVSYDAVIDVRNDERLLKPGMTTNATFVYATKNDVVRISNAALRFHPDPAVQSLLTKENVATTNRADERLVWISHGVQASPLVVRVGITDGTFTEIVDGNVQSGDRAIVEASADKKKSGT